MRLTLQLALYGLLALAGVATASPIQARNGYAVKGSHRPPEAWTKVGDAPGNQIIQLHIMLKQAGFAELERHFHEVSDPFHKRYGQHLSDEEVNELVAPSVEADHQVLEWLRNEDIATEALSYSPARDRITLALKVSQIERLLDTKYSVFEHKDGHRISRTLAWSLPVALHDHIDTIQPTNSFFRPQKFGMPVQTVHVGDVIPQSAAKSPGRPQTLAVSAVNTTCDPAGVTNGCLRSLYGTIDYKPTSLRNKVALTNFLGEYSDRNDARAFLQQQRPEAVSGADKFTVIAFNGGNTDDPSKETAGNGIEADLDTETILGFDYPLRLITYNTGGQPPFNPDANEPTNTNEPYADFFNGLATQNDLPQTISISYGDEEKTVPLDYAQSVCNSFLQYGAKGVTFLVGSGDVGVGTNCANDNDGAFIPSFPASCPYVTTVGATKNFNPEVAAYNTENGFRSGGGFSNYFPRPDYQKSAVANYITGLNGQFLGYYNGNGRGYPDVSAQGQAYSIVWHNRNTLVDGTSASTPTFAAIVALVNDYLLANGKKSLGFLNPLLYAKGYQAFTDVTSGSALGCGGSGFPAAKGWDAVTGFGTPQFSKLQQQAIAAQSA